MNPRPFLALMVATELAGCRSSTAPKQGCPPGTIPVAVGDTVGWVYYRRADGVRDSTPMVVVATNTKCFHRKAA